jgi:RHS repeat-associated protein
MVAINEILLRECTGEGCGGDNDICTDSLVHHRKAENRAPVTRNRRSAPLLGRWVTRDPIWYRGGTDLYRYAKRSPAGGTDALGLAFVSPGYPLPDNSPPPPVLSEEAAQALLDLIASLVDFAWLPEVAAALAGLLLALAAWAVACRAMYAAYKSACNDAAKFGGCEPRMPCSQYPPRITAWALCANGRQAYLDAGCDIIIPTRAKHRMAAAGARQALANCVRLQPTCVPYCPAPQGGIT